MNNLNKHQKWGNVNGDLWISGPGGLGGLGVLRLHYLYLADNETKQEVMQQKN